MLPSATDADVCAASVCQLPEKKGANLNLQATGALGTLGQGPG
jgi:hypothetical protein